MPLYCMSEKIALIHRVLCCKNCELWTHKKCANISNVAYNQVKNENADYFCTNCKYKRELQFFLNEDIGFLIDEKINNTPDRNNQDFENEDFENYDVVKKKGLHFIHISFV